MGVIVRTLIEYVGAARALLPPGLIWAAPDETSNLGRLLMPLSQSVQRVDAAAAALLIDAFPPTAVNLLPEWESTLGLPDSCTPGVQTIAERQQAVAGKLVASGGQSRAYFLSVASAAGLYVEGIEEFTPMSAGMPVGTPLYDSTWAFVWRVHAASATGSDPVVECLLRKIAPAHTVLLFVYRVAPFLPFAAITTSDGSAVLLTADGSAMITTDPLI